MTEIFDVEAWREVVVRALGEMSATLATFLPSLVGAAVILAVGWAVSKALEIAAVRALHGFGLDRVAVRLRVAETLDRAGVGMAPSAIVARLLFWLLMLTFVLSAVETLGLSAVTETIDRLIAYIPSVIGAGLIAVFGLLLARFLASLVSSGAAAAGLPGAPRLGVLTHAVVATLVFVAAVEQLGVRTEILVGPFTALVAAVVLTAGLAFALGARPIVTHVLAGHFLRQSLPPGASVEVEGERGVIERVGATDTVVRGEERTWSLPNARLLEQVVIR